MINFQKRGQGAMVWALSWTILCASLAQTALAAPPKLSAYANEALSTQLPEGWTITWIDQLRAVHATPDTQSETSPSVLVGLAFEDRAINVSALMRFLEQSVYKAGKFSVEIDQAGREGHFVSYVNARGDTRVAAWLAVFGDARPSVLAMSISRVNDFKSLDAPDLVRRIASATQPVGAVAAPAPVPAATSIEAPAPSASTPPQIAPAAKAFFGRPLVALRQAEPFDTVALSLTEDGFVRFGPQSFVYDPADRKFAGAWRNDDGWILIEWADRSAPPWRLDATAEGLVLGDLVLRPIKPLETTRLHGTYRAASKLQARISNGRLQNAPLDRITFRQDGSFVAQARGGQAPVRGMYEISGGTLTLIAQGGDAGAYGIFQWPAPTAPQDAIGVDGAAYLLVR